MIKNQRLIEKLKKKFLSSEKIDYKTNLRIFDQMYLWSKRFKSFYKVETSHLSKILEVVRIIRSIGKTIKENSESTKQ